jgi:hypothetical protein
MKVSWLIDADMFEGYREELASCIRAQGHDVKLVRAPSPPYRWEDAGCFYRNTFGKDACVVAHGDIELATRIIRERLWIPGGFGTIENYFCSRYFCHLGKYLLNGNYVMLPFAELSRCREFLLDFIGVDGKLFVRPDSPLKLFTGQVASRERFDADLEFMNFYEFPANSIVVVSAPKVIEKEWRFIVADKQVVTGCQYKSGGAMLMATGYDDGAYGLAKEIASGPFEPDAVWVMDICRTREDGFFLLEIGGFSFADLYACDKPRLVKAVSASALRLWRQEAA